ncbi:MAG: ATP-binding cassette domain-containing protein, partial [Cyclobacteriaceae bacterium]
WIILQNQKKHPIEKMLKVENISKSFSGVQALQNVSLELYPGMVTAIVGENGAGKSTLMKILSGVYADYEGKLFFQGEEVSFSDPKAARDMGIGMIHQELNLIPYLSIRENIFLGRELQTSMGFLDFGAMRKESHALMKKLQLKMDPDTPVSQLKVGQQQLVEIAKALAVILTNRTKFGRYVYAIGGNERAARLSGININKVKMTVYAIAGGLAAIGGIIVTSRLDSAQPNAGISYELDAIAAVVIGGTSLSGGKGSIMGAVLGGVIIGVLNNGLVLLNVSPFWQQVVKGLVILLAVIIDKANSKE